MNNEKKATKEEEIELLREMLAWIVECRVMRQKFLWRALNMKGMQATVSHPLRRIDLALNHAEDDVLWSISTR